MTVHLRVQHAPGRTEAKERLLRSLQHPAVVVTDEGSGAANPWRGYKLCLTDVPPQHSHVCVLQDDTVACRNFPAALELIAAANPETVVCLFLGGAPRRTAARARDALAKRRSYVEVHGADFVPVVATMWPTHVAKSFLEWCDLNPLRLGHRDPRSDDAVAGRWMRFTSAKVVCTVPSLVQHPDDMPSTIGKQSRNGADRNRVAAFFIENNDPLEVDWSRHPTNM